MKSKVLVYISILISYLLVASCTKKDTSEIDPQGSIYQDLKVTYQLNENKSIVQASFRENNADGIRLKLSDSETIKANNEDIPYRGNLTHYFYQLKLQEITDIEFKFVRNNQSEINQMSLHDANEFGFPADLNGINSDENYFLKWTGEALKANESMSVFIKQGDKTSGISSVVSTGDQGIVLKPFLFDKLESGNAKIYLYRTQVWSDDALLKKSIETEIYQDVFINK